MSGAVPMGPLRSFDESELLQHYANTIVRSVSDAQLRWAGCARVPAIAHDVKATLLVTKEEGGRTQYMSMLLEPVKIIKVRGSRRGDALDGVPPPRHVTMSDLTETHRVKGNVAFIKGAGPAGVAAVG